MKRLAPIIALAGVLFAAPGAFALDVHNPAVQKFITRMVVQHQFQRAQLEQLLAGVEPDQSIIQLMEKPAEALPWYRYRAIFVTPGRAIAGSVFVAANRQSLAAAEDKYGVPPAVVAALIGMESLYGKSEGSHSALTALATLAFDYPRRAEFFRKELSAYLLLCRENHFDPAALKSSYAGALGAAQFMPSSYLAYAVAAGGNGSNLFTDWPDIIASVAHYLGVHGWRAGEPVAALATVPAHFDPQDLIGVTSTAQALRARGVIFKAPATVTAAAPARLVEIETGSGKKEYWVGLPNFMVLMAYNHSVLYALAATQLAAAIDQAATPASSGGPLAAGDD